jgi:hypothetical protein
LPAQQQKGRKRQCAIAADAGPKGLAVAPGKPLGGPKQHNADSNPQDERHGFLGNLDPVRLALLTSVLLLRMIGLFCGRFCAPFEKI